MITIIPLRLECVEGGGGLICTDDKNGAVKVICKKRPGL